MFSRKFFLNFMISILLILGLAGSVSAQDTDLPTGIDETQQVAINYRAHVAKVGWGDYVESPQEAGTTGQGLPIETVEIQKNGANKVSLTVTPHVQDKGWSATRS